MHLIDRGAFFFIMIISELLRPIENWAPPGVAWDKDNTGLQVGDIDKKIKNVLICLELTKEIILEATDKKANLIISHHPLIFYPLKKLSFKTDTTSQLIELLIKNNITHYSAHTNLDFTQNGVSISLAKKLGLLSIKFLREIDKNRYKVVVFVPKESVAVVSEAIFDAGGGIIGEYSNCSFRTLGTGTFSGSEKTNPFVGKKCSFEAVEEVKLEVITDKWQLSKVIKNLTNAHPYEEPAFDIIPLENKNGNFGMGAIGEFEDALQLNEVLGIIKRKLGLKCLKHSKSKNILVKKVALCGGSGMELMNNAIASGADLFLTSDIKYHSYFDAEGKIVLVDAGHYETEVIILETLKDFLTQYVNKSKTGKIGIFITEKISNPIDFFI